MKYKFLLYCIFCYLLGAIIINVTNYFPDYFKRPLNNLELSLYFDDTNYGSVKLVNNTNKDVYNITVVNESEDYDIENISINKLESGKSILRNVKIVEKSGLSTENKKCSLCFRYILIIILICFISYLTCISLRKNNKLNFLLGLLFLFYIIYFMYMDYLDMHLDKRYLHTQVTYTDFNNSVIETICNYTETDMPFIDSNNNDLPDCIEEYNIFKDTDGDGLSDYVELCYTNTNMLSVITYDGILDSEYDTDKDGLSNAEECNIGSNPLSVDTDGDGLSDYDEYKLGTDLLNIDTDKDGLNDYMEVCYNTEPLEHNTIFNVELSSLDKSTGLRFTVSAVGDGRSISDFNIESVTDNFLLSDKIPGYIGTAFNCYWESDVRLATRDIDNKSYTISSNSLKESKYRELHDWLFYDHSDVFMSSSNFDIITTEGLSWLPRHDSEIKLFTQDDIDAMFKNREYLFAEPVTITFEFNENLLKSKDFCPCIYYYDDKSQSLTELDTDVVGNKASAIVNHFSTYILLNKAIYDSINLNDNIKEPTIGLNKDIVILLDNSNSMRYNDEVNFRIDILKRYFNSLSQADNVKVYSFTKALIQQSDFTNDYDYLLSKIQDLEIDDGTNKDSGTYYLSALYTALDNFDKVENRDNEILLFTDGRETKGDVEVNIADIIRKANQLNIHINVIGLGVGVKESKLKQLAYHTGGIYLRLTDMINKTEVDMISKHLIDSTIDINTDTNSDGLSDYYTDLIVNKQLLTNTKISLDIDDLMDKDWDEDGLLNGEEIKILHDGDSAFIYMYSNPLLEDTDNDGILDKDDTAPLTKGLMGGIIGRLNIVANYPENTTGHAYLVYESIVNDEFDISNYLYASDSETVSKGYKYSISNKEIITFGNFAHLNSLIVAPYNLYQNIYLFGEITCNCELYSPDKYMVYKDTNSYSTYITQESLDRLFHYLDTHNYYNVYTNNCATIAANGWNESLKGASCRKKRFNASVFKYPSVTKIIGMMYNPVSLSHLIGYKDSYILSYIDMPSKLYRELTGYKDGLAYLYNYSTAYRVNE